MKNFSTYLFLFLFQGFMLLSNTDIASAQSGTDTSAEGSINFSEQSTWVLGYLVRGQITRAPHSLWFTKEYNEYLIKPEALKRLLDVLQPEVSIKVVLGTWCPDSRKQVPRFLKITDSWNFPDSKITYIGVDDAKLSPVSEYEQLKIDRVPTFIFYRNNIEAGRIIENPLTSLEQDMVDILTGKD